MGNNVSIAKIQNYYEAAYLLSQSVPLIRIEKEKNRTYYYFDVDEGFLSQEIALFKENDELNEYVKGIIALRNLLREYNKQHNNPQKKKPPVDKATETLHPIED